MTSFDPRTVHSMPAQQFGTPRNDVPQFGTGQLGAQGFPGQQYPGPVPPPPLTRPTRTKRPLAAKIVAGMVAAGLVVGGAGTWMALSGSSAEAAVQTTSFAGANPTTSPFGTDAPQVAAVAATGPQSGGTAGLYATTTPAACTTADYLTQLQADPAKLAAVGGVFGLGATDVPAFVDSLSPVVLRAATAVTDHPYADGAFTEQPAVLAAGTAVLVNSYGEPTVKCFNGNPLTAGAAGSDAVTVTPTTQVISQFSFTTVDNSRVVVIPGKPDPKPTPGPNPTTTPQPDPELVKKAEEAKKIAEQARSEATAAREKADTAAAEVRRAQSALTGAEGDLARAIAEGANPAVIAELTKVRDQAKADLDTRNSQFKNANSAANSAEGTADQADKNAKDAKDAQQKADDSAKTPAQNTKPAEPKKVDGPAVAGQEGQTVKSQTPANTSIPCGAVADSATAAKDCTVPSGSADTATTPADEKATDTGAGSTSTGSQGTSAGGTSSNSSSSTGGSQSGSKEGSDK
jgi:hypothetical protein